MCVSQQNCTIAGADHAVACIARTTVLREACSEMHVDGLEYR